MSDDYVSSIAKFHRDVLKRVLKALTNASIWRVFTGNDGTETCRFGPFCDNIVAEYQCEYEGKFHGIINVFQDADPKFGAYVFGSVPIISEVPVSQAIPLCRKILGKALEENENYRNWYVPDDVFCTLENSNICGSGNNGLSFSKETVFVYDLDYGYTRYPVI